MSTRDHCKAIGDVASYNKWGRLAIDFAKDLDMLRVKKRDNLPPPQHHYEIRTYAIVQSVSAMITFMLIKNKNIHYLPFT